MTYILDTNAWILLVDAPERIPQATLERVRDMTHAPLGLAAISPWEVAKKTALGKLQLSLPVSQWIQRATNPDGIQLLPLTPEVALESAYLPGDFHRDPADQLIVATARLHNLVLVTSDQRMQAYPYVNTVWNQRLNCQSIKHEFELAQAETKILALTPARGRGKRQITEEAELVKAIDQVLKAHRVEGFLQTAYVKQTECRTQYVGRGRGSAERDTRVIEKVRYHITEVTRHADRIDDLRAHFGWKALVTNATAARLSLADAVLGYRHEYRVERMFNRLKSRLHIVPMFVSRDDQIQGLTYLLTLGVWVLTVMEFTLRRSLQKDQTKLPGLHPENRNKCTDKPTAERVLKAFSKVTLTILKHTTGREVARWVTPLSSVQQESLQRLGLAVSLYQQLEILHTRN